MATASLQGYQLGDSGKVSQAGRITKDLLGQLLGAFVVGASSRKFMQQPLLSSSVHKIKSISCSIVSTKTRNTDNIIGLA